MPVSINIDMNLSKRKTDFTWQMCVGSDHAFQAHRTDYFEQLRYVHNELGFRYVRFHGILNDCMNTYQSLSDFMPIPGSDKINEVNFHQIGKVYDNIIRAGMKPFVELSFMPTHLASGSTVSLHYKANVTSPKDYEAWAEHIRKFLTYLLNRYGKEEVESWYFEVWNEPDLSTFWDGTREEYFKLYKYTVKAIKSVDKLLRVGGPSTSKNRWLQEFIDFCKTNNVSYDFISTHHYPGDPFGHSISSEERRKEIFQTVQEGAGKEITEVNTDIFYHPDRLNNIPKGMLSEQTDYSRDIVGDTPLFYTEWNSSSVFGAEIHDTKYSAAFAVKTIMDLESKVQAYSFWCFSDIFEEIFFLTKPFNGSFGLLSIDGIPKPNFWAFKILSKLYPDRLYLPIRTNEDVEYAAFTNGKNIQVLVYAQSMKLQNDSFDIDIMLNMTASEVTCEAIDDVHCNPKQMWIDLNKPDNLTPGQVEEIKEVTMLKSEPMKFIIKDGNTTITTQLCTNDIKLITFIQ